MPGRRLRLLDSPFIAPATALVGAPVPEMARQQAEGRCLAIADLDQGELALRFAAKLTEEFARLGRPIDVVLSSYAPAGLDVAHRRLLSSARSLRSVCFDGSPLSWAIADDAPWLLLGEPALVHCRSWLSVLLSADRPLLRWPSSMRPLKGRCTLEISGAGLTFVAPLVSALATVPVC